MRKLPNKIVRKLTDSCLYCQGENITKRGTRKKKLETIQLYWCKDCKKTFTPIFKKGKHYPLETIFRGLSLYNLGYSLEETVKHLKEPVKPSTLARWLVEFKAICKYERLRPFAKKLYLPEETAPGISLYHRQVYKFRIHRAKLALLLEEDIKHRRFWPLRELLESLFQECPHHLFKQGLRASEIKTKFSREKLIVRNKTNFANDLARLVLEGVSDNKKRHQAIQDFFIYNDSVTVAAEVPIYLLPEDIEHMESQLDFEIPLTIDKVLTGHIDLIQLRNGSVHILDYKPDAKKEEPIEQLTLYALALSRLTGLRLYDFKCAWFDEHDYFEFFPLHAVYKMRKRKGRRISKNQISIDALLSLSKN